MHRSQAIGVEHQHFRGIRRNICRKIGTGSFIKRLYSQKVSGKNYVVAATTEGVMASVELRKISLEIQDLINEIETDLEVDNAQFVEMRNCNIMISAV